METPTCRGAETARAILGAVHHWLLAGNKALELRRPETYKNGNVQSLATGRLATFSLPYIDCELASDPDQTIADDGSTVPGCQYTPPATLIVRLSVVIVLSWKARFGAECVSAVVLGLQTARAPKYSVILDLDRKIRDMALPKYSEGSPPNGVGLVQTMSHFTPINYRHTSWVSPIPATYNFWCIWSQLLSMYIDVSLPKLSPTALTIH